ncbi:hypothetical protein OF83DRAFT_151645 [Amylostereum chailletii]|nr:hypothetical protein OF83DRAFT_151645 [Amylostereum chailletii]
MRHGGQTNSVASAMTLTPVDKGVGALFIGWGLSSMLFGVLVVQGCYYYQRFPKDGISYKSLVALLVLCEFVHQGFAGHSVWYYSITDRTHASRPANPVWTLTAQLVVGLFIGTIVKICYGIRVWKFSGGNVGVTCVIFGLTFAQLGVAVAWLITTLTIKSHSTEINGGLKAVLFNTYFSMAASTDLLTAISLSYYLHKMRKATAKTRVDRFTDSLLVFTVTNGVVTSICSMTLVILFNTERRNFIYTACYFVLTKVYSNSCLATFNIRRYIGGKGTEDQTATGPTFFILGGPPLPEERYKPVHVTVGQAMSDLKRV